MTEHDACSTVATFGGNEEKNGHGCTVFRSGAAIQNRYADRQKTQNDSYGGRFSQDSALHKLRLTRLGKTATALFFPPKSQDIFFFLFGRFGF